MKKILLTFLMFIFIFPLTCCDLQNPKYINFSAKPSNHYYSDELRSKILSDENFTIYVFDTNLYKEIPVEKEQNFILENFLNCLIPDNYVDEQIKEKEAYRLKVVFSDYKYLIKIYNNSMISISPWDGNYKEDIISMDGLPLRYNLLDFCSHIQNRPLN